MKKLFALVLVLAMVFSMSAMAEGTTSAIEKGTIVYGSVTDISGDFAPGAWWTNNATDNMIRSLSNDYATVVTNQYGEMVENPTVLESMDSVVNDDGTKTYTLKIKEGLTYNNGEAITAKDFAWYPVFACSPVATEVGAKLSGYLTTVGGQDYYDGKANVVSGVRLIDDYTFSYSVVADKIPYFYDLSYASFGAYSMKYWLGEDIELMDDGEGCYFNEAMTAENISEELEYARFNANADRVSAGPYNLVEFDKSAGTATLTINPNYAGNFEGVKPSVETIVITKAEEATWIDAIKTGAFNFYDQMSGSHINDGMDIIDERAEQDELEKFAYDEFDRAGYGYFGFACDVGPTQFAAVRQAVALLLDRVEFANTYCEGWGGVVNGPYGTGMWQYVEAEEWIMENLNDYAYNPEAATELLVNDGWTLNAEGGEYTEGIRYKKVTDEEAGQYAHVITLADGTKLMPLIIEWASSEGNPVSELLKVMLAEGEQTAAAGMQINQNVMTFEELLNYLYRDATQGDKYAVPTYCCFNLAAGFTPLYDYAYNWTSDPELVALGYNINHLFDDQLDQLSMDMVYGVEPEDTEGYMEMVKQYLKRWNELLPEIPLYSDVYVTMYPEWLENYDQDSFWGFDQAIVYATVAE